MKMTARGKADRASLHVKLGNNLSFNRKTHKLYKTPSREEWTKLINHMPCEEVSLNKDGSYDTSKAPDFHNWLKNG